MKQSEIVAAVLAGRVLAVVEYRGAIGDDLEWRDKRSGAQMKAVIAKHSVEFADGRQLVVSEGMPEGTKSADVKSTFKKGQRVVLEIETIERVSGFLRARGIFEPLDLPA